MRVSCQYIDSGKQNTIKYGEKKINKSHVLCKNKWNYLAELPTISKMKETIWKFCKTDIDTHTYMYTCIHYYSLDVFPLQI